MAARGELKMDIESVVTEAEKDMVTISSSSTGEVP